jgi:hypothetical protein
MFPQNTRKMERNDRCFAEAGLTFDPYVIRFLCGATCVAADFL